jgi:hypothetical protein
MQLTFVIDRPASECNGDAVYIGPTAVDFSMLMGKAVMTRISERTTPAAPTLKRELMPAQEWHVACPAHPGAASVPRAQDITGESSDEDTFARHTWNRERAHFQNDKSRFGFGTEAGKKAWLARIQRTRTA